MSIADFGPTHDIKYENQVFLPISRSNIKQKSVCFIWYSNTENVDEKKRGSQVFISNFKLPEVLNNNNNNNNNNL